MGYAAHTIGHKKITVNITGDDNNDINGTNAFDDDTNSLSFQNISVLESDSGIYYGDYTGSIDSVTEETISESESTSRTLIVVSVRGSVTLLDWIMDFLTQFHVKVFDFETGRDMMMKPKLPRQTLRARDLRQLCLIAKVTIVLLLM